MSGETAPLGGKTYRISAPGLSNALEAVRRGDHVHLVNEDDPDDRMCSAGRQCEGFDYFYLESAGVDA
jgi:hypothetical protein